MAKNCIYCGAELTEMGNAEGRYDDTALVAFLKCPRCGRDYEVSDPPKEDRETQYKEYWEGKK